MRLSRPALSALLCLGAPATAWAQDGGVQISLTAAVGVTDNVGSTPDDAVEGVEREAGGTFDVSPGFAFNYITPRTTNRLQYAFTFGLPDLRDAGGYTLSNALLYGGQFETSPTTSLSLGVAGTHGHTRELTGVGNAATTPITAQPEDIEFFRADVSQGFTKALSPTLDFGQSLSAGGFFPLSGDATTPASYTVGGSLTLQTSWRDDSVGVTLTPGYTLFLEVEADPADPAAVPEERRHSLLNNLAVSWRRDFTDRWASQVALGVTYGIDPSDGGDQTWTPSVQVSVLYTREQWQAELANSLATQPNVLTGEIVFANTTTLRMALPIYTSLHNAVATAASAGFQNSRPIQDGNDGSVTNVFLSDAALTWSPLSLAIDYEMSLRYQFTKQWASGDTAASFTRNTVLLAVTGAFDNRARETTPLITGPYRRPEPEQTRPRAEPAPVEE